jgi:glycosyltransferase involved in cell wall biosynthesis
MEISIIIPVYNSENSILYTLESVRHQTFKDFEIIIVNDGSHDISEVIIKKYIEENPDLIIIYIQQTNQGVSKARNVGMRMAKGNWIALLDSDDEWLPNKLERQMQILKLNPQIDFLGTNRNGEHFNFFLNFKIGQLTKIPAKILLYKMLFITPTVIFKNSILNHVGYFDENQSYCEDANYFIKIALKKESYLLNESLVITGGGKTHFEERGLSSNLWAMQKGEFVNLNYALKSKIINLLEYFLISKYYLIKYIRRVTLIKKRSF